MRVFVTGATGWIGSAVVDQLLDAGHEVTGLARSDASAAALRAKGARAHPGDLDDLDGIRAGSAAADAVVHLANKHDFVHPEVSDRAERDAVQVIGDTLEGSHRPFVVASGLGLLSPGGVATEADRSPFHGPESPRGGSENLALEYADKGVNTIIARFAPTVHGAGDHGFVAVLVAAARSRSSSGYVGDGANRWSAVHRTDAARLVRLAIDKEAPAGTILHAAAESGVPTRAIAEGIGQGLGLPVVSVAEDDAAAHFGWLGRFFALDMTATADTTRALLGWSPTGPTLLEDLPNYF
ncbi:SDR family oxidoreductase [Actinokineospora inagensis]|uniref:SDR family oxidoreductase n=1 Tax=Actinokineospora inagensis TaxID=103730 RepID=UPI00040264B7|nr:SDR family oxidoreductase [Actinokineospora inagensis]